jgi:ligand-binding SRPBCC domain-containing protein
LTIPPHKKDASASPRAEQQQRKQRLSFITDQWVPFPIERVFAFFADPTNLPRLMPVWQDARIDSLELHSPGDPSTPGAAGRGSRILLSFRPVPLSPIRLHWLAQIDEYVANHHFCDLQVTGPFGYWRHCHLVSPEPHGDTEGTRITDVVDYQWLRGSANRAIDALGGRLQIRRLFRSRHRKLLRLLRQETWVRRRE